MAGPAPGVMRLHPDHTRGRELAALLLYCSPNTRAGEIDQELRDLVVAAADVPADVHWPESTHYHLALLEQLRAELAQRLRAAGHGLVDGDPDSFDESDPARVWRWLDLTPTSEFEPPFNKDPWSMTTESTWFMPGRAPLGEGVLRVRDWLNATPATAPGA
jgi:hypothetical protein